MRTHSLVRPGCESDETHGAGADGPGTGVSLQEYLAPDGAAGRRSARREMVAEVAAVLAEGAPRGRGRGGPARLPRP